MSLSKSLPDRIAREQKRDGQVKTSNHIWLGRTVSNSISVLSQSALEPQVKRDPKKPKDQTERPAQTRRLLRMSEQRSRSLRKKSVNDAERENQRSDACALE